MMGLTPGGGPPTALLREARSAWKFLNGVVCIYKHQDVSLRTTTKTIRSKLCQELNSMELLPRQDIVQIRRISRSELSTESVKPDPDTSLIAQIPDGKGVIEVIKTKSYADHPLVVGAGYQVGDIKMKLASYVGKESSGLAVIGINGGCKKAALIELNKWLKTYIVSGQFGKATDTFFHTGKVLEKSAYHNIRRHMIDRTLAVSQASHQRMAFDAAGIPLDSDRAYELASQGLIRPQTTSAPIIYQMKCLKFDPPDFDLEISSINEREGYLRQFIHELGLRLHSVAVCTKIRCIKVGPFNLDMALLNKHWTLEHFIQNMKETSAILKDFKLDERDPLVEKF